MEELTDDENESSNHLPILEWMNHFFSPLDVKHFVVSKRAFKNTKPSSVIKSTSKPSLYTCFLASLEKHHEAVESRKKIEKIIIQNRAKQQHLKPEIVQLKGTELPGEGKLLVDFDMKEGTNAEKCKEYAACHDEFKTSRNIILSSDSDKLLQTERTIEKRSMVNPDSSQQVVKSAGHLNRDGIQLKNNNTRKQSKVDYACATSEAKVKPYAIDVVVSKQEHENSLVSSVMQHLGNIVQVSPEKSSGIGLKDVYVMKNEAGEKELQTTREIFRQEQAIEDIKSSKQQATCKWNIPMFAEHVTKENFKVLESLLDDIFSCDDGDNNYFSIETELKKRLIDDSKIYADVQKFTGDNRGLNLKDLAKNDANETVVRSFLNHILSAVSISLNVTLHPEQYLPGREFSCPRCDYVFKMNGINIGSVEVKAANYINRNVIVQLLLQLLKMQCINKSSDICYFGLLTDGYRYIFVLLKGLQFIFESEIDLKRQSVITSTNEVINVSEKVRIFYANTWNELFVIVKRSVMLLQDCVSTLNKCTTQPKINDYFSKNVNAVNEDKKKMVKHKLVDSDKLENGTLKKTKQANAEPDVIVLD